MVWGLGLGSIYKDTGFYGVDKGRIQAVQRACGVCNQAAIRHWRGRSALFAYRQTYEKELMPEPLLYRLNVVSSD